MEIIKFFKWQWNKWEIWQRWYCAALLSLVLSFPLTGVIASLLLTFSIFVFVWYIISWSTSNIRKSYQNYKKEKADLFETINRSDKTKHL